jgi:PIN domain nuclease of toxin-antitoxin system
MALTAAQQKAINDANALAAKMQAQVDALEKQQAAAAAQAAADKAAAIKQAAADRLERIRNERILTQSGQNPDNPMPTAAPAAGMKWANYGGVWSQYALQPGDAGYVAPVVYNAGGGNGGGGTGGGGNTTPAPVIPAGVSQTATDVVNGFLKEAGLGAISKEVWSQWTSGTTAAQIIDYVRTTPDYATRFPAMKALNAAGRNISEASYIAKEQADIEIMRQAGISDAIATNRTLLGDLIKNNVNIVELQKRTLLAQDSILSKDPSVLKYAKDAFGLSAGDLMAFALAPEIALPVLEQQARAIQIGGAALQAGFATDMASNELKKSQAEALAAQGVTAEQAKTGFTNLAQMGQYGTALPGSNPAETLTQQELIDAQFGMSPEAIMKLQKAKQTKTAEFQQGGAFAATQAGVTGLGMGPSV